MEIKAKILISVKNCNIDSDIELNPKIVNGTKIFFFYKLLIILY